MMAEMVSAHSAGADPARRDEPAAAAQCPAARDRNSKPRNSNQEAPLNEVSPLTELAAMRMLLTREGEPGDH